MTSKGKSYGMKMILSRNQKKGKSSCMITICKTFSIEVIIYDNNFQFS